MKVGNKVNQNTPSIDAGKSSTAKGVKTNELNKMLTPRASRVGDTAKINLSDKAQALQKAKDIASDSSINEARVSELQNLIDSGNYKVDAKAVADRLIDEHLEMVD